MRKTNLLLALGLMLGVSGAAFATCTSGADPCNAPRNGAITANTATTISMSLQNAATPNVTSSIYFFEATTLGSVQNTGTPDRNTVIVFTADFTNPALATDVIGQTIKPLLASSSYNLWGKVCPPGSTQPTDAGCSAWVSVGSRATSALTNAGFNNIAAADTLPRQFTARTNGSVVDQTNVIAWLATNLNSTEVGNCTFSSSVQPFPGSGTTLMTVDSTDCSTLVPNRPYTLVEHLIYDPTQNAPNFTSGVFYTQAADPVAIDPVASVTHCSAVLNFQNAAANPANPNDTTYSVNIGGPVASGSATQTKVIGGTGIFSDANSVTFTNLIDGQNYSPAVTALNRGGGSWRASNADGYTAFTTVAWGGNFSIGNVTTTTVDFTAASVNTAGVSSWQIVTVPAVAGLPSGNAANLNGTHTLTGLNPNTVYTVRMTITEGSGCSSSQPVTPIPFTTTPLAPTNPSSFSNVLATSLQVNWTNPAGNSAGTSYQVELCTNAGFTTGCQSGSTTSAFRTFTVSPVTTYFARVKALNRTGSPWQDSAYLDIGSVTTPPNQSAITVSPNPGTATTGSPTTFTATVTDQTGAVIPGSPVTWAYSNGNGQLSTTNGPSTVLIPTSGGSFTLTASKGAPYADVVVPVTVSNAGPAVSAATVSMNPDGITANLACTASDPGYAEPTLTYTWSLISPAGASVSYTINGTNAAKNSVVTLTQSGSYIFRCTVTDPAPLSGFRDTTATARSQILSALSVSPNNVTISVFNTQAFTATGTDQFGAAMSPGSVVWTAAGGNVNGAGVFQPSTLGTNLRVTATNGSVSGSAFVSVVNFDVSSAFAFPVPYKSTMGSPMCFKNLGTEAKIRIYTTSGRLVYNTDVLNADNTVPCPFPWNVKNNAGENLASGIYLYVIESPTTTKHGKLIIIQ